MTIFNLHFIFSFLTLGVIRITAAKKTNLIGFKEFRLSIYLFAIFLIVYVYGIYHNEIITIAYLVSTAIALSFNFILILSVLKDARLSTKTLYLLTIVEIMMLAFLFVIHVTGLVVFDIYIIGFEFFSRNLAIEYLVTTFAVLNGLYLLYLMTYLKYKKYFKVIFSIFILNIAIYLFIDYFSMPYFLLVTFLVVYMLLLCFGNDQGFSYEDKSKITSTLDIVYFVLNNKGIIVKVDGSNQVLHQKAKGLLHQNYEDALKSMLERKVITKVEDNIYISEYGYTERFEKYITKYQKVVYLRNVTDEYVSMQDILNLSYIDELTKLSNRKALYKDYQTVNFTVEKMIYFDLNKLKYINDNYSHMHGDRALVHFARNLESFFPKDNIYRLGGDEFLVITRKFKSSFKDFVISDFYIKEEKIELGTSMGYVDCSMHSFDVIDDYLALADKAMYVSKNSNSDIINYDDIHFENKSMD